MDCPFKSELEDGKICCDSGGMKLESGTRQCPTVIFNICQSLEKDQEPIPESLDFCKKHYILPIKKYISCNEFGNIDGMNGRCHWCKEMTPYQWHMCLDEAGIRRLLNPYACEHKKSRAEAIEFIEHHKQQNSTD